MVILQSFELEKRTRKKLKEEEMVNFSCMIRGNFLNTDKNYSQEEYVRTNKKRVFLHVMKINQNQSQDEYVKNKLKIISMR